MFPLLKCLLYSIWSSDSTRSSDGGAVVGGRVMMCCSNPWNSSTRWTRLNQTTGVFSSVLAYSRLANCSSLDSGLLIPSATIEDSGHYRCSDIQTRACDIHLTVVEPLSAVRVSAVPEQPVNAEGRGVSLRCDAASFPASLSWTWQRQAGQAGWRAVGTGRELTLTRAAQSGYYRCRALSNVAGLVQEALSPEQLVYIVSLAQQDVSYNVGVAALILTVLLWLLLVPLLLWMWTQRVNHLTHLQGLANSREVAEPAKPPKGGDPEPMAEEGEVYMNYDTTSNKNYCDLQADFIPGDDIYDIVS